MQVSFSMPRSQFRVCQVFRRFPTVYTVARLNLPSKAFLLTRSVPIKTLKKKLRHDLKGILRKAKAQGIESYVSISPQYSAEVLKANSYYSSKEFEYFQVLTAVRGYTDLPNLGTLDSFASEFVRNLESVCVNAA
jgi:hypothetical protein